MDAAPLLWAPSLAWHHCVMASLGLAAVSRPTGCTAQDGCPWPGTRGFPALPALSCTRQTKDLQRKPEPHFPPPQGHTSPGQLLKIPPRVHVGSRNATVSTVTNRWGAGAHAYMLEVGTRSLASWVALDLLLNLSGPLFPHL